MLGLSDEISDRLSYILEKKKLCNWEKLYFSALIFPKIINETNVVFTER